jgi:hypothetical protein
MRCSSRRNEFDRSLRKFSRGVPNSFVSRKIFFYSRQSIDHPLTHRARARSMDTDHCCSYPIAVVATPPPPRSTTPPRQITRTPVRAPDAPYHHNVRHVIACIGQHSERSGDTQFECAVCRRQRRAAK